MCYRAVFAFELFEFLYTYKYLNHSHYASKSEYQLTILYYSKIQMLNKQGNCCISNSW